MAYFNYHAKAKSLIAKGKLKNYYLVNEYNGISPALVLVFDDASHPVMPIRKHRWTEYFKILPPDKYLIENKNSNNKSK